MVFELLSVELYWFSKEFVLSLLNFNGTSLLFIHYRKYGISSIKFCGITIYEKN